MSPSEIRRIAASLFANPDAKLVRVEVTKRCTSIVSTTCYVQTIGAAGDVLRPSVGRV